jgi:fumarylacetoacetase
MKTGDLLGSGAISGQTSQNLDSLLEQSLNGKEPTKLEDGDERTFLEAGNEITIQGVCRWDGGQCWELRWEDRILSNKGPKI